MVDFPVRRGSIHAPLGHASAIATYHRVQPQRNRFRLFDSWTTLAIFSNHALHRDLVVRLRPHTADDCLRRRRAISHSSIANLPLKPRLTIGTPLNGAHCFPTENPFRGGHRSVLAGRHERPSPWAASTKGRKRSALKGRLNWWRQVTLPSGPRQPSGSRGFSLMSEAPPSAGLVAGVRGEQAPTVPSRCSG